MAFKLVAVNPFISNVASLKSLGGGGNRLPSLLFNHYLSFLYSWLITGKLSFHHRLKSFVLHLNIFAN